MKYRFLLYLLIVSLPGFGQHTNVLISDASNPEEPTIVINPKNTDQLVAGANINNVYYSQDGGQTWTSNFMASEYFVWGDPCVIVDTLGHFYYFHLSNTDFTYFIDRMICQKSTDGGMSWSELSYFSHDWPKQQDKEWAVVDRANNNIYVSWTQFDSYGSYSTSDSSVILFTRSLDAGATWSQPLRINKMAGDCIDSDNTVEGAVPTVGPNGEVYVAWVGENGIYFDRSIDMGISWLEDDIFVSSVPGGWDYVIPGLMRCNGLPVTACDTSGGPYHGTIYINWSDQRNGSDDTDIWLAKSTDGGNSWTNPIRVNDDPAGKHQFLTWMAIDQVTGYLWFVFYDRRNYYNALTDVYMAVSKDGGQSFQNFKISESHFAPSNAVFMGDYNNITAHNNVVRPIWTRLDNTQLSVWTALVNTQILEVDQIEESTFSMSQNSPNPFSEKTLIKYKLYRNSTVSLKVLNVYGQEVAILIDHEKRDFGRHILEFDVQSYDLPPGLYFYSLISDQQSIIKKMIVN
ncbi:MAG: T9SS type A sorting domain-containing protein [Bacteroidales bacterium]|nr:T9SS type A sorting domain-containing protein [Bacteroidales bacterium]MCF8458238.1 T9SS type A sorting domain-containing protein [Bacteroidales bacterium]